MRLVQLRIKNIASLKSDHLIDLEAIQAQSPLFAITGETGSGKSTILNAIGLVLYGQIYKKNVTQVDVVTLGEKEGEIQLIFQVGGKSYLAEWRAKVRKQNGELLQKPIIQRLIFPIEGNDFSSTKQSPIESIERLLNLDFDQFCKCIILNQGEFARFLSSSFTERKDILEKLYPGELLDRMGKELKAQLDDLEKQKSELEIKLGELQGEPLSGESLVKDKERLKQDLDLHENWSKKVEGLEFHFISLSNYHTKFLENKKKADLIRSELSTATTSYNKVLKEHESITEIYQAVIVKQQKELPRLQELLKSEEALKHNLEAQQLCNSKVTTLENQLLALDQSLDTNKTKVADWKTSHQALTKAFKFKIDDLKRNREILESVFELHAEFLGLKKEQKIVAENLQELEALGKEINQQYIAVTDNIKAIPTDLAERLLSIESKKNTLSKSIEQRQQSEFHSQEITKQIDLLQKELPLIDIKISKTSISLVTYEQENMALETTLKLQELTLAIEVCLTHASDMKADTCPVCNTALSANWNKLLINLNKADITSIKSRSQELSRIIMQLQEENKISLIQSKEIKDSIKQKTLELTAIKETLKEPLSSMQQLEEEAEILRKKSWDFDKLKEEEVRINNELAKARANYSKVRTQSQELIENIFSKEELLKLKADNSSGFLSYPLGSIMMEGLKEDYRLLSQFLQSEMFGEKLEQERKYMQKDLSERSQAKAEAHKELSLIIEKINGYQKELVTELAGKSAQELIEKLNSEARDLTEKCTKSEKELKLHELTLKDYQGRLYGLDEQLKEYDLLFVKELHAIREAAVISLAEIKKDLSALVLRLKDLSLEFSSPSELFVPIKDILTQEKESLKETCNTLRMSYASINQRLMDWEKRQDKILVLKMTRDDIQTKHHRLQRLFEVLGKDELRSFVLSLVEENLIIQTNEELQKLCQGRYEIIHQVRGMRMTPEFYILDKFREGGRRKVSTLSGGETFMVSLAMALALAEMTRGNAEIDSLFIDEGFGTLDQDSLEDVLDMLNQIQTRGLMVGIISHIKALTDVIPVNLILVKKQDGTSSIKVQAN